MNQQSSSGGSKSTDFQPITENPQSNVNGGLQPNSANLQPTTSSDSSNIFNQPGVNPQAFPKTDSLQVLSTGSKPDNTNKSISSNASTGSHFLTIFIVAVIVTLIIILAVAKLAVPAQNTEETNAEEPEQIFNQIKPKKKSKNKNKKSKKRNKK